MHTLTHFPSIKLITFWISRWGGGANILQLKQRPLCSLKRNLDCVFIQCSLLLTPSVAPVWGGRYVVKSLRIPCMGVRVMERWGIPFDMVRHYADKATYVHSNILAVTCDVNQSLSGISYLSLVSMSILISLSSNSGLLSSSIYIRQNIV